jgi:hypothetical protein
VAFRVRDLLKAVVDKQNVKLATAIIYTTKIAVQTECFKGKIMKIEYVCIIILECCTNKFNA